MIATARPALLILVDALPASTVGRLGLLRFLDRVCPLRPGLGYSITQKAEMLTGALPDEQGILNHYQPVRVGSVATHWAQPLIDSIRHRVPVIDHVFHKLWQRVRPQVLNVPWEQIGEFYETPEGYYEADRSGRSLLSDFRLIIGEDRAGGFSDLDTLRVARERIDAGEQRLFVSLAELDQLGHACGPESSQFANHALRLDAVLRELSGEFLARHTAGVVVVFSDHGMLGVNRAIRLPGSLFDTAPGRRARYWLDSTMLRVWGDDDRAVSRIADRLVERGLEALTVADRQRFGVTSRLFGDLIYVLPAGAVFVPNSFGSRRPRGMHGYHPDIPEHFGCVGMCGAGGALQSGEVLGTLEFYRVIGGELHGTP